MIRALEGGQDIKMLSAVLGHTRAFVTRQGYGEYLPKAGKEKAVCGHCGPAEEGMRQAADKLGELFIT